MNYKSPNDEWIIKYYFTEFADFSAAKCEIDGQELFIKIYNFFTTNIDWANIIFYLITLIRWSVIVVCISVVIPYLIALQ